MDSSNVKPSNIACVQKTTGNANCYGGNLQSYYITRNKIISNKFDNNLALPTNLERTLKCPLHSKGELKKLEEVYWAQWKPSKVPTNNVPSVPLTVKTNLPKSPTSGAPPHLASSLPSPHLVSTLPSEASTPPGRFTQFPFISQRVSNIIQTQCRLFPTGMNMNIKQNCHCGRQILSTTSVYSDTETFTKVENSAITYESNTYPAFTKPNEKPEEKKQMVDKGVCCPYDPDEKEDYQPCEYKMSTITPLNCYNMMKNSPRLKVVTKPGEVCELCFKSPSQTTISSSSITSHGLKTSVSTEDNTKTLFDGCRCEHDKKKQLSGTTDKPTESPHENDTGKLIMNQKKVETIPEESKMDKNLKENDTPLKTSVNKETSPIGGNILSYKSTETKQETKNKTESDLQQFYNEHPEEKQKRLEEQGREFQKQRELRKQQQLLEQQQQRMQEKLIAEKNRMLQMRQQPVDPTILRNRLQVEAAANRYYKKEVDNKPTPPTPANSPPRKSPEQKPFMSSAISRFSGILRHSYPLGKNSSKKATGRFPRK